MIWFISWKRCISKIKKLLTAWKPVRSWPDRPDCMLRPCIVPANLSPSTLSHYGVSPITYSCATLNLSELTCSICLFSFTFPSLTSFSSLLTELNSSLNTHYLHITNKLADTQRWHTNSILLFNPSHPHLPSYQCNWSGTIPRTHCSTPFTTLHLAGKGTPNGFIASLFLLPTSLHLTFRPTQIPTVKPVALETFGVGDIWSF